MLVTLPVSGKATTGKFTALFVGRTEKSTGTDGIVRENRREQTVLYGKIDGARQSMPVYLVPLRAHTVPKLSRKFPARITVVVGNTDEIRGRIAYYFLLCMCTYALDYLAKWSA